MISDDVLTGVAVGAGVIFILLLILLIWLCCSSRSSKLVTEANKNDTIVENEAGKPLIEDADNLNYSQDEKTENKKRFSSPVYIQEIHTNRIFAKQRSRNSVQQLESSAVDSLIDNAANLNDTTDLEDNSNDNLDQPSTAPEKLECDDVDRINATQDCNSDHHFDSHDKNYTKLNLSSSALSEMNKEDVHNAKSTSDQDDKYVHHHETSTSPSATSKLQADAVNNDSASNFQGINYNLSHDELSLSSSKINSTDACIANETINKDDISIVNTVDDDENITNTTNHTRSERKDNANGIKDYRLDECYDNDQEGNENHETDVITAAIIVDNKENVNDTLEAENKKSFDNMNCSETNLDNLKININLKNDNSTVTKNGSEGISINSVSEVVTNKESVRVKSKDLYNNVTVNEFMTKDANTLNDQTDKGENVNDGAENKQREIPEIVVEVIAENNDLEPDNENLVSNQEDGKSGIRGVGKNEEDLHKY